MRYSESVHQKATRSIHGEKKCDIKCKNGHPSKHALRKRADTYIQGDSGCLFLITLAYTKCREIYVHGINCEVNARTFVKINFLSISRVFLGKDARDNICNCFDSLYVEAFFHNISRDS